MRCDECIFFKKEDDIDGGPEDPGECRRYPPILHPSDNFGPPFFTFPQAEMDGWCGEFQSKYFESMMELP